MFTRLIIKLEKILQETENRNETISILQWTPKMDHNGRVLTCRAAHVKLEYTTIEAKITLDLHCKH